MCGMELQHNEALIEQNQDQYLCATKCTAAIDKIKSTVNFVLSLNLLHLKMGGGPHYSRMRGKSMDFLKAENLYMKQFGITLTYTYEQVVAFSNSC